MASTRENRRYQRILAFSLVPQILLVQWAGQHPEWVERYYSEGTYPYIAQWLRTLFGWIPFSAGDIFYTLVVFGALRYLFLHGKNLWRRPWTFFVDLGCTLAIAHFLFYLLWGLNYHRLPINEKMGFGTTYTKEELIAFTRKIARTTNRLHLQLVKDSAQAVHFPYSTDDIYQKTLDGYASAAAVFPYLEYRVPSLKSSLYSLPLSYMGYGGYVNPFTNEAQVNDRIPKVRLPSVSGHEVGHQLGYSSESSTNFIGLLVTAANPDPYFKYAAQSHGLAYCLSDLKKRDEAAFKVIYAEVNSGVKKNYAEMRAFWDAYENPTEPVFKAMFNAFLKANAQEEGIQSYNAVVGLLIGFDRGGRSITMASQRI